MRIMTPAETSTSNTRKSTGIHNQPQSIIVNEFKTDVHPPKCTAIYAEDDVLTTSTFTYRVEPL
jgi:hypothetical protein